jgi:hypothetical protein
MWVITMKEKFFSKCPVCYCHKNPVTKVFGRLDCIQERKRNEDHRVEYKRNKKNKKKKILA